jgi:hypothetical protein
MTKAEKVGAIILVLWCIGWLAFIFLMPAYGTGVLNGN